MKIVSKEEDLNGDLWSGSQVYEGQGNSVGEDYPQQTFNRSRYKLSSVLLL